MQSKQGWPKSFILENCLLWKSYLIKLIEFFSSIDFYFSSINVKNANFLSPKMFVICESRLLHDLSDESIVKLEYYFNNEMESFFWS